MTLALSHGEAKFLKFLIAHVKANGISPSYDKCLIHLGLRSKNSIARLVAGLERKGHIRRMHRRANSIEILFDASGHAPTCSCDLCAGSRYGASRNMRDAIAFGPDAKILRSLIGLRSPTVGERALMLGTTLKPAGAKRPANRTAGP